MPRLHASLSEMHRTWYPSWTAFSAALWRATRLARSASAPPESGNVASSSLNPSTSFCRISSMIASRDDRRGQFHLPDGKVRRRRCDAGACDRAAATAPEVRRQRHRPAFAVRVDRRVGHLGERLLQVLEQRRVVLARRPSARGRGPCDESGSFFSLAMSLTNTARSKSQPAACSRWSSDQLRSASIAADRVVGLAGVVEPLGDDDLPAVQLVDVAEFGLRLGDDAAHDLVAVEPLAGRGVEGDHLARLELAAGDDGGRVEAEHAGLAADVEPAALVRAPAHRAQAHAVDEADERSGRRCR